MAERYIYEVHLSDGSKYDVTTEYHHGDHDWETFARHLLDIVKSATSGVISGVIVHFLHKGRK